MSTDNTTVVAGPTPIGATKHNEKPPRHRLRYGDRLLTLATNGDAKPHAVALPRPHRRPPGLLSLLGSLAGRRDDDHHPPQVLGIDRFVVAGQSRGIRRRFAGRLEVQALIKSGRPIPGLETPTGLPVSVCGLQADNHVTRREGSERNAWRPRPIPPVTQNETIRQHRPWLQVGAWSYSPEHGRYASTASTNSRYRPSSPCSAS